MARVLIAEPLADAGVRQGHWERSRFQGTELYGKTLGIVGLGRVGALVAQRCNAFGMRLLAHDPFVSRERAAHMGVEPATQSPLFELDEVVVTPHLGASTAEAQDKAGVTIAEQLLLALAGQFVPNAVNVDAGPVPDALRPFLPLVEKLGRIFTGFARGGTSRAGQA